MRKIIFPIFVLMSFVTRGQVRTTSELQEITPKSVIEKYLKAIGGAKAVNNIKDFTMEIEGQVQGQTMNMLMQKKMPNKLFTLVNLDNMGEINKTIFNGSKASVNTIGQAEQIVEGEDAKVFLTQSSIVGEIEYLADTSYKMTFIGKETIDSIDCNVVKIKNGAVEVIEFYDINSGLKIRQKSEIESPMGKTSVVIDFKDYKSVSDIKFPHLLKQDMGVVVLDLKVKAIKINQNLDDSIFEVK